MVKSIELKGESVVEAKQLCHDPMRWREKKLIDVDI